jgi:hypothetical protein
MGFATMSWQWSLHADAPKLTALMKTAMQDLKLDQLSVLYPGTQTYLLADNVVVMPISSL